jgi:hypothetical protein
MAVAMVPAVADGASGIDATSAAAKTCKVPKLTKLLYGKAKAKLKKAGCKGKIKIKKVYSNKLKAGRVLAQSPKAGKKVKQKTTIRITLSLGKKLCVVKKKNKAGKLVTVYQTKIVKKKVRNKKTGKVRVKKVRVFVYKFVTKKVKGKKKRVKVKVPKMGPCKKKTSTQAGVPVVLTLTDASVGHIDFGAFVRDIPLSGTLRGFITGKGFQLGKENLIQLTSGRINLAPTGIFIDDVCDGQVSDSIRTDENSYSELDPASTANNVRVKPDATLSGLLHLRIQIALDLRNDDFGCNEPYFTTGWTDFTVPLFVTGKIGAQPKLGLISDVTIGETVLDDLSACLAQGDPNEPCNGFAIPFPGIFSAEVQTKLKVG